MRAHLTVDFPRLAGALLLALALSVSAAGLAPVGPDYKGPPPSGAPARFKYAKADGKWKLAEPRDHASPGAWWRLFHDASLDRLEAQAVSANQDLQIAIARIQEAHSQVRVAAADLYPNIDLEPGALRQRSSNTDPYQRGKLIGANPFAAPGGAGSGAGNGNGFVLNNQPLSRTYNVFHFPLDLTWELDLWGRVRRNKEAARAAGQAMEADAQNVLLSATSNLAANYFNIRGLDAELDVLDRTVAARREAVRIAAERLQAGLTSDLDLARARSDLALDEAEIFAVTRNRAELENAMATLMGRPASGFSLPRKSLSNAPPAVPPGLPSQLLERRPDVAQAERQLAAANARIGVATAAFYPRISLTGDGGFESGDIGRLFDWQSRLWQIGANAVQPLFEGGRNAANLNVARAQYDEATATYRKQVLIAFQEVETALVDIRTLAGQASAQAEAVDAARQTVNLAQKQYSDGAVNFLDVLDSQRTLLTAERGAARILGLRAQATVQLIKAIGGGW